jgi:hypothetical protein
MDPTIGSLAAGDGGLAGIPAAPEAHPGGEWLGVEQRLT